MAESVVVSEQPPQRFFCHLCNIEVESVTSVSKLIAAYVDDGAIIIFDCINSTAMQLRSVGLGGPKQFDIF